MFSRVLPARAAPAASAACRACRPSFAMPLRAKFLLRQPQRAMMSTTKTTPIDPHSYFRPRPDDEPEDVVFHSLYGLRTIELNRPRKFNALNGSMIRKIGPRLIEWEKSDMANVIVMKGAGETFCAGGDVKQLAQWNQEGPEGQQKSIDYFAQEYRLNHLIATCGKPYVAFMDGITMGGGVGLSIHAPFRIATERTVFAMPETNIGFFPDVGATFALRKLPGSLGTYLALTSDRLKGANAYYAGVATHYLHSTSLPSLESRLAELRFKDYDTMNERLALVNATIEEFCTGMPHNELRQASGAVRVAIDRCFSKNNIGQIIKSLEGEVTRPDEYCGPEHLKFVKPWAKATLDALHKRSPTSLHVTMRQMHMGSKWSIAETFVREHAIASAFMHHHDFVEGVTSAVGKPRKDPKWEPASLQDIDPEAERALAEQFIGTVPAEQQLTFVHDNDYTEYPYNFALPTEQDLKQLLARPEQLLTSSDELLAWPESEAAQPESEKTEAAQPESGASKAPKSLTKEQVIQHFLLKTNSKQGVVESLEEIIARTTTANVRGKLVWTYHRTLAGRVAADEDTPDE